MCLGHFGSLAQASAMLRNLAITTSNWFVLEKQWFARGCHTYPGFESMLPKHVLALPGKKIITENVISAPASLAS